jgi:hypothetical protein
MPSNAIIQKCHAAKRAKRRYGITLNAKTQFEILHNIRNNIGVIKTTAVPHKGRSICRMMYNGRSIEVIVDAAISRIITFLPRRRRP